MNSLQKLKTKGGTTKWNIYIQTSKAHAPKNNDSRIRALDSAGVYKSFNPNKKYVSLKEFFFSKTPTYNPKRILKNKKGFLPKNAE